MKILILGGNGMIGHKMYEILNKKFDVWVLIRKKLDNLFYSKFFDDTKVIDEFNLEDFASLDIILHSLNPDIIINCAGITTRRATDNNLYKSIILNSALPFFLNEFVTGKKGKRLIHFSTDCVFSGRSGGYTEESIPDANDLYGKTKSLGEVIGPQTLILRGSMIGRELDNHTELFEWFISQKNNTVMGYSNAIFSGITTIRMSKFVEDIIIYFPLLFGLYNVSSHPISKYELLNIFNNNFNAQVNIEKEKNYTTQKDLISTKFYNITKFQCPTWEDLVKELHENSKLNNEYYKKI